MSTYFVPGFDSVQSEGSKHLDGVGEFGPERVGPTLSYYQWTPFFLLLCAFFFYSPCLLWRKLSAKSGLVLSEIVAVAKSIDQSTAPQSFGLRMAKVQGIARHLTSAFRHRLKWHKAFNRMSFCERWQFSESVHYGEAYLSALYLSIKMLFISIVFLQAWLLNRFLQTDVYDFYGWGVFTDLIGGKAWNDSGNFPRVTFCDIDVRILGAMQRHTVQCVLVINIFTEKVFLLLWLWYTLLLFLSVLNLFGWLFALLPFASRKGFVLRHLQMANIGFKMDEQKVDEFVRNFLKADGCFLLRMIETHTTEWACAEIVDEIWKNFVESQKFGGGKIMNE